MPPVRLHIPPPARPATPSPAPASTDYRKKLFASLESLPPLPTVLNELLHKLNDEDYASGPVATLIEKDSVLSGSVLRCVNSAYYGLQHRVSSIRHAVTLLGFSTVRNLALAFSMRRMLSGPRVPSAELYSRYSQHSLACATMTQFLAHYTRSQDVESAFAAGLFHDIGRLVMMTTVPEMIPNIISHWEAGEASIEEAEQELLQLTHSELSQAVLRKWKLPESIQTAVLLHHQPPEAAAGEATPLALLVHAADLYANAASLCIHESEIREPESPFPAFEALGLSERLPQLTAQFQQEFAAIRQMFHPSSA